MRFPNYFERWVGKGWRFGAPRFSDLHCYALLLSLLTASVSLAKPYIPENEQVVLIKRDYPVLDQAGLREKSNAQVDQLRLSQAVQQAKRFVRHALAKSDTTYFGFAKAELEPWWNHNDVPSEFRVLRAIVLQQQHQFDSALEDLNHVLQIQPSHVQARLTRAAIYLVTGELERSRRDCRALFLKVDNVTVVNCLAQVQGLTGESETMEAKVKHLFQETQQADAIQSKELLLTLAELKQIQGNFIEAEHYLEQALLVVPGDAYVVDQLCQLLLKERRYSELYSLASQGESLQMRLYRSIVESFSLQNGGVDQAVLSMEISQLEQRGDLDANKLLALYYLYIEAQPKKAYGFAKENWRKQKSISDALLLLETSDHLTRMEAKELVLSWVNKNGVIDVRLEQAMPSQGA